MGLDMYAYATEKDVAPEPETTTELYYWRKNNALHGWIADQFPNQEDNCEYLQLTEEMLERLKLAIREQKLKPREGFFFGSQSYDLSQGERDYQFCEGAISLIQQGLDVYYYAWY